MTGSLQKTATKKVVDGFVPNFMEERETQFYGKVLRGKGKTKFVFRYDR